MKKILLLVLSLTIVFSLAGCKKDDEVAFEFDVPDRYNVNIYNLGYIDYINLNNPVVTINVKDMGEIVIQLFPDIAPNSVNNFIKYIQDGSYTDNEFHRVVNGFMLQGGYLEEPSCYIDGEMGVNGFDNPISHTAGVLSMARGNEFDSANSQFFIVHRDSEFLDSDYAAFGGVTNGFHIIDYIASFNDVEVNEIPSVPIYIDSITVELNGYIQSDPICVTQEAE